MYKYMDVYALDDKVKYGSNMVGESSSAIEYMDGRSISIV